jgi:hypothetical protein
MVDFKTHIFSDISIDNSTVVYTINDKLYFWDASAFRPTIKLPKKISGHVYFERENLVDGTEIYFPKRIVIGGKRYVNVR